MFSLQITKLKALPLA